MSEYVALKMHARLRAKSTSIAQGDASGVVLGWVTAMARTRGFTGRRQAVGGRQYSSSTTALHGGYPPSTRQAPISWVQSTPSVSPPTPPGVLGHCHRRHQLQLQPFLQVVGDADVKDAAAAAAAEGRAQAPRQLQQPHAGAVDVHAVLVVVVVVVVVRGAASS